MNETTFKSKHNDSALSALFSAVHQSTTKEAIQKAAQRRTLTCHDMQYYWNCLDWPQSRSIAAQKKKKVIHITGTKGKGSTACFCESILRHHGYQTGLFTSPHLIDIRERIRWNGLPIHPNLFAKAYWKIRNDLERCAKKRKHHDENRQEDNFPPVLPGYFRMLTLMAYYTFFYLIEDLDVLIVEVGMGGRYDASNFINWFDESWQVDRVACGVTLLDLDHTRILGTTLEQIAWEKGGIFAVKDKQKQTIVPKPCCSTSSTAGNAAIRDQENGTKEKYNICKRQEQKDSAVQFFILDSNRQGVLDVFEQCARLDGDDIPLQRSDANGTNLRSCSNIMLGLAGQHQYGNATLAINLCESVINKNNIVKDPETIQSLREATWPGRCQTIPYSVSPKSIVKKAIFTNNNINVINFRLDGAHTPQSLKATMEWFTATTAKSDPDAASKGGRILIFNTSHERNPTDLLQILFPVGFQHVYFAKSDTNKPSPMKVPTFGELIASSSSQPPKQEEREKDEIMNEKNVSWQDTLGMLWDHIMEKKSSNDDGNDGKSVVIKCNLTASQALDDILKNDGGDYHVEVLVTGSLYLVGSFLTALGWKEESSPDI